MYAPAFWGGPECIGSGNLPPNIPQPHALACLKLFWCLIMTQNDLHFALIFAIAHVLAKIFFQKKFFRRLRCTHAGGTQNVRGGYISRELPECANAVGFGTFCGVSELLVRCAKLSFHGGGGHTF